MLAAQQEQTRANEDEEGEDEGGSDKSVIEDFKGLELKYDDEGLNLLRRLLLRAKAHRLDYGRAFALTLDTNRIMKDNYGPLFSLKWDDEFVLQMAWFGQDMWEAYACKIVDGVCFLVDLDEPGVDDNPFWEYRVQGGGGRSRM